MHHRWRRPIIDLMRPFCSHDCPHAWLQAPRLVYTRSPQVRMDQGPFGLLPLALVLYTVQQQVFGVVRNITPHTILTVDLKYGAAGACGRSSLVTYAWYSPPVRPRAIPRTRAHPPRERKGEKERERELFLLAEVVANPGSHH